MRLLVSLFLIAHGIAHFAGFLVYWKITEFEEMPYRTTLFAGKVDVGDTGIRVMGIFWLLGGVAFILVGVLAMVTRAWWESFTLVTAGCSLLLSASGWPDSKFGVAVNLLIIAFLVSGIWSPAI